MNTQALSLIKNRSASHEIDIFVCPLDADVLARVMRHTKGVAGVRIIRTVQLERTARSAPGRLGVAITSTSYSERMSQQLKSATPLDVPVIWVKTQADERLALPFDRANVLPPDFTQAELDEVLSKLLPKLEVVFSDPVGASEIMFSDTVSAPKLFSHCPDMNRVIDKISVFHDCDANVLLNGEVGAGKAYLARTMHAMHPRFSQGEFVAVNCSAIPVDMFDDIFWGGPDTGELSGNHGYVASALGGTLFLDEIGAMPLYHQSRLLNVLQAQADASSAGNGQSVLRVIAASSRNLGQLVKRGHFLADLYYRLAVLEFFVPNLEERGGLDKIALFKEFVSEAVGRDLMTSAGGLPYWLADAVSNHYFSGNVGELKNTAQRIGVVVRQTGSWSFDYLQPVLQQAWHLSQVMAEGNSYDLQEKMRVIDALNANGWRRQDTARHLDISRKVLWEKMRKYQLMDKAGSVALSV